MEFEEVGGCTKDESKNIGGYKDTSKEIGGYTKDEFKEKGDYRDHRDKKVRSCNDVENNVFH